MVPNASKTEIVDWLGDALKIRVRAVPENGKANKVVIGYLTDALDVERSRVCLLSGESSPLNGIRISGVEESEVFRRLGILP